MFHADKADGPRTGLTLISAAVRIACSCSLPQPTSNIHSAFLPLEEHRHPEAASNLLFVSGWVRKSLETFLLIVGNRRMATKFKATNSHAHESMVGRILFVHETFERAVFILSLMAFHQCCTCSMQKDCPLSNHCADDDGPVNIPILTA